MKPTTSVNTEPFTCILRQFNITANMSIKPVTPLLFQTALFKNTHFNVFSKTAKDVNTKNTSKEEKIKEKSRYP